MGKWLSSCVKERPEVKSALADLSTKIHEYKDAANPLACGRTRGALSFILTLFRPRWWIFAVISIGFGILGVIFYWRLVPNFDKAGEWATLTLRITVPTFTIGLSLVALSRTVGDSLRFSGEYLNESCRTPLFCCLTLVALLWSFVAAIISTINLIPDFLTVVICSISIGMSINSLMMLAFEIFETMRCSVPSKSIEVVSGYAARKLTGAYLKESYAVLLQNQQKIYLEKWCAGNTLSIGAIA